MTIPQPFVAKTRSELLQTATALPEMETLAQTQAIKAQALAYPRWRSATGFTATSLPVRHLTLSRMIRFLYTFTNRVTNA